MFIISVSGLWTMFISTPACESSSDGKRVYQISGAKDGRADCWRPHRRSESLQVGARSASRQVPFCFSVGANRWDEKAGLETGLLMEGQSTDQPRFGRSREHRYRGTRFLSLSPDLSGTRK